MITDDIDLEMFRFACVFMLMEGLRDKGLIIGGPGVNREAMQAAIDHGRALGWPEPSTDEIPAYLLAIRREIMEDDGTLRGADDVAIVATVNPDTGEEWF